MTYRQARPNQYACVRHLIAELHFFVLKELDPAKNYSMCYVHVADVDAVYETLCESLKRNTNRIPVRGYPKITKPNSLAEDRRFNLVDPSGNRILIGTKHAAPQSKAEPEVTVHASKFRNAFETAYKLAYAKDDPAHAAKVLDLVLPRMEEAPLPLRYRAVILRICWMRMKPRCHSWIKSAKLACLLLVCVRRNTFWCRRRPSAWRSCEQRCWQIEGWSARNSLSAIIPNRGKLSFI